MRGKQRPPKTKSWGARDFHAGQRVGTWQALLRNLSWARKAHVAHMPETLVLSINREEVLISCNLGQ
jgi:hypothetical protein